VLGRARVWACSWGSRPVRYAGGQKKNQELSATFFRLDSECEIAGGLSSSLWWEKLLPMPNALLSADPHSAAFGASD
jgi:hypothetical protein